jgi:Tfp pilus assembly protein PilX
MLNERGMTLPLTLLMLVTMASLTLALLALAGMEPQISRNLADATQARFAAEAGIEWAFDRLASTPNWNTLLASASPTSGVLLGANQAIGTLSTARGTYTVWLRNDTQGPQGNFPGDQAITGVALDSSHTQDANNVVIVTSTGTVNGATKTIRAAIKRLSFPPGFFPGAMAFPGTEAEVSFNGNSFEVDGRGWRMDGSGLDASCAAVYGISVSSVLPSNNPGANEAVVESALSSQQQDNVKGKPQNPNQAGEGRNTIAPNTTLTPAMIQNFIDQAKNAADIVLESRQPNGLTFNNIGSTCATDPNSQTCWGTATNPKIVYVRGEPDPSSMFSALQIGGNTTGYGILIVEDGDLRINGNFAWYGPVIVTGRWVGVGFMGGGNQQIYGALISNETATDPGFREGVMTGNSKVRYSCEALNAALTARRLTSISTWKDLAPNE